jgi:ribosomal subunit interface protein
MNEEITIGSSNVDLGEALRSHVRDSVLGMAEKYLQNLVRAGVHFNNDGNEFHCSVNVQAGSLPVMAAEASAKDCYVAFKVALNRVGKQMRRTKRAVREDKAARDDKEMTIREGLRPIPD